VLDSDSVRDWWPTEDAVQSTTGVSTSDAATELRASGPCSGASSGGSHNSTSARGDHTTWVLIAAKINIL